MRDTVSRSMIVAALLCAALGLMMACGAGGTPPSEASHPSVVEKAQMPEIVNEVALEAKSEEEMGQEDPDVELRPFHDVNVVTVKRGEGIRFIVKNLTAWILIPDGHLQPGTGGTEWSVTDSYIAVKIDKGSATVVVPIDYPSSKEPTEIRYSVLAETGTQWDYIHGKKSPPRMIIPP